MAHTLKRLALALGMGLAVSAAAQSINYTPQRLTVALSADGGLTYQPYTNATGVGPVSFTPTYFVPMCSTTGAPPFSQCSLTSGGGGAVQIMTNGVNNASQTILNFITSTANVTGLTVTPSNPLAGSEKMEITGTLNMANLAGFASGAAGDVAVYSGTAWTRLAGNATGTQCLQETSAGVASWGACGAGGGDTITSPGASLTVGGTPTATTLDFNLSTAHTWLGAQGFSDAGSPASSVQIYKNATQGEGVFFFDDGTATPSGAIVDNYQTSPVGGAPLPGMFFFEPTNGNFFFCPGSAFSTSGCDPAAGYLDMQAGTGTHSVSLTVTGSGGLGIQAAGGPVNISGSTVTLGGNAGTIIGSPLWTYHAPVASAATVILSATMEHVSGTAAIANFTPTVTGTGNGQIYQVIADGAWTTVTSGNIKNAISAVIGQAYTITYDGTNFYIQQSSGGTVYPGAGIPLSTGTAWGTSYSAQGTDTKLLTSGTVSGTGVTLCTDANGGATTTGCSGGGATAWSAIGNPTANLALTMATYTSTFTYNAATGASDLFALTDTTSNTGTGILFHAHTQSGSTEIPWQADANGVGWQITAAGVLQAVGSSATHGMAAPEGTALSGVASSDVLTSSSTYHQWLKNVNNGGPLVLVGTNTTAGTSGHCVQYAANGYDIADAGAACGSGGGVANTTVTVGTTAVAANSCSTVATATMTGLATTMTLNFTPNSDVHSVTGWGPGTPGLYIIAWPSASNTASYYVCNSSASSITPGASVTFNVSAK